MAYLNDRRPYTHATISAHEGDTRNCTLQQQPSATMVRQPLSARADQGGHEKDKTYKYNMRMILKLCDQILLL